MMTKKDGISLFILVAALILVNVFGSPIDALMWPKFTLFVNCILVQGMFITLVNLFRFRGNRSASKGLILLSLLAGLISLVIIMSSEIGLLHQIFLVFIQALITYAESLMLRKELKGEDGRQI